MRWTAEKGSIIYSLQFEHKTDAVVRSAVNVLIVAVGNVSCRHVTTVLHCDWLSTGFNTHQTANTREAANHWPTRSTLPTGQHVRWQTDKRFARPTQHYILQQHAHRICMKKMKKARVKPRLGRLLDRKNEVPTQQILAARWSERALKAESGDYGYGRAISRKPNTPFSRSSNHQANIEQLEHTSFTSILNAFAGCLLDDCSMFVWSCKRGISLWLHVYKMSRTKQYFCAPKLSEKLLGGPATATRGLPANQRCTDVRLCAFPSRRPHSAMSETLRSQDVLFITIIYYSAALETPGSVRYEAFQTL